MKVGVANPLTESGLDGLMLEHLRSIAPNSVQDIPAEPYGA